MLWYCWCIERCKGCSEVVVHGTKRIALTNEAGKGLVSSDLAKEKVQLKRSVITVKF